MRARVLSLAALGGLVLLLAGTPAGAQQSQGIVRGQIQDASNGSPIVGAQVAILGTSLRATSGTEGRFVIRGVPAGSHEVVTIAIGFASQRAPVEVVAGGTSEMTISLTATPYQLEELVVTALGEQRSVELGHKIDKVSADSVVTYSAGRSVTDLLIGKSAGVNVLPSSGTVGAGTRIRIRGASSVSLSNDPLLFVDGIRVSPLGTASIAVGTGGQAPSRLDDLTPEEIENIQIVKGAAAATLYGTEASSGILQITTKQGRPGPTRWSASVEQGVITDNNKYPTNFTSFRHDTSATPVRATCLLTQVAAGTCTQDSIASFNVLENPSTTPIGSGYRQQYNLQASGGSDQVTYFVSGLFSGQTGTLKLGDGEQTRLAKARGISVGDLPDNVIRPNYLRKYGVRANVHAKVSSRADVTVSAGYTSSNLRLPQNDNNVLGVLPSGYFGKGSPVDTVALNGNGDPNGGWGFFRPGEIFSLVRSQNIERLTGGITTTWRPISFLNTHATVGYDIANRTDVQFDPTNLGPAFGTTPLGTKADDRTALKSYTVDVGGSANYRFTRALSGRTSVGGQFFKDVFYQNTAVGQGLAPGSQDIDGAATLTATETTTDVRTIGAYVEQLVSLKERLFVTAGLRVDDNSAFGANFDVIKYPKVSVSYFLSDEGFFPKTSLLSTLRLRGAYGQAGRQPGALDGLTYATPVSAAVDGSSLSAITVGGIGLSGLKPERSKEIELGFDAGMLRDRLGVEFTYYNKITDDILLSRVLPPSSGGPTTRVENLGSVRNYGAELALTGTFPIGGSSLELRLTGSILKNNLRTLGKDDNGAPIPAIVFGNQRHQPNYPLGSFWDFPYTYKDTNGDGIIALSEMTFGASPVFIGSVLPTREFAFRPAFTTFRGMFRLGAQLDYRGGNYIFNNTEAFRCTATGNNCRALHDPKTPLAQQAAAVARRFSPTQTTYGYVEKGEFLKLREVSLTFTAPQSFARLLRASAARFTVAGRNLATASGYSGVDPEVQSAGQNNFTTQDFLTQPQVRTWLFRASFDF
jgi:TonB-linked SusC/RagA family outer membrane protein